MLNMYIDTALLATPNYAYGLPPQSVEELINRLIHIHDLLISDVPINIYVSDNAENVLGVDYPYYDNIDQFLTLTNLRNFFSADDLTQIYEVILDRSSKPCNNNIFDVTNHHSFSSNPPLPNSLSPNALVEETQRVLATVAAQDNHNATWRVGSAMNNTANSTFLISTVVVAASQPLSPLDGPISCQYQRQAITFENLAELIDYQLAVELWSKATTAEELHLSITLGSRSLRKQYVSNSHGQGIKKFTIGDGFYASLQEYNCSLRQAYSHATFELCCQIIADIGVVQVKQMGKPSQDIRARDKAGAYRSHISGGGIGMRLMHWEVNHIIEFANVGPKLQLYIEQGTKGADVFIDTEELLIT